MLGASTGIGGVGLGGVGSGQRGSGVVGVANGQFGSGVAGSATNGVGVVGLGGAADLLAGASGIVALAEPGTDGLGSGTRGDLAHDAAGNLWHCFADGTGNWLKLAGPATAGAFHPVAAFRVFDSRFPSIFATGNSRLVRVADAIDVDTGVVRAPGLAPVGATAVTANLTITGTSGAGFVAVNPGGDNDVNSSSINSAGGVTVANAGVFKLDANRGLQVIAGGAGSAHVLIDITGYYL
ncbi:MAG: hypothetical protein AAFP84_08765 [Actinomycetota bacterium]